MADEKRNVMTEEGLRKLQEQYDYLINVKRKEIINAIEVARENARKNGLDNVTFEAHNCFDHLRELTDAYTVFYDGYYHPARSYYHVTDAQGSVLLSNLHESHRVLSLENAAIMTKMLEGSKNLTFTENNVKILSALSDASRAQIAALAEELMK